MKLILFLFFITVAFIQLPHPIVRGQTSTKTERRAKTSNPGFPKELKRQPSNEELAGVAAKCNEGLLHGRNLAGGIPEYPAEARKERASGTVVVQVYVNERGRVYYAKAISGPASLQRTPVEVAYRARFKPFTSQGKPIKCTGTLDYNFVWP